MIRTCKLTLLCLSLLCFSAQAAAEPRVSQLTPVDLEFMQNQRLSIDELARSHFGQQINGDKANDLSIIQKLLDRGVIDAEQTLELQALGLVLGDLLAADLGMVWVIYEDKLGRSRALRMPKTDYYLFPVTMIARRVEADAPVDALAVYDKAYQLTLPHKPALPFQ